MAKNGNFSLQLFALCWSRVVDNQCERGADKLQFFIRLKLFYLDNNNIYFTDDDYSRDHRTLNTERLPTIVCRDTQLCDRQESTSAEMNGIRERNRV